MTVVQVDDIWSDPSDGYSIRVVRYPYSVEPEGGGLLMGFSFHTGVLWSEIPGQDNPVERPEEAHIVPLVKTHTQFTAEHLERGFRRDTHYLLGRRRRGFPLRVGSRPAVEGLLAELKTQWQEYRRASNPEFRIEGLRAIRRARAARDSVRLEELKKRYARAAAYDRKERLIRAGRRASSVLGSVRAVPDKSSVAARVAVGKVTKGSRKAVDAAMPLANGLMATTQGLLASALSTDLNALVQNMVKGPATIYDKAMDAKFLETHIGGPDHRMTYTSRLEQRDAPVLEAMRDLARQYPRYGYRRIQVFLARQGCEMSADRAYRLWRQAGLQVPRRRPRRRIAGGRPRPTPPTVANHVWAYDFVYDRCANGEQLKCLTVVDEWTRECLAIQVSGSIRSRHVIEVLVRLVCTHGAARYLRSDNGPEFVSRAILQWLSSSSIDTALIDPGKPWQNATSESFNDKFRDECLSLEWFRSRAEAKVLI